MAGPLLPPIFVLLLLAGGVPLSSSLLPDRRGLQEVQLAARCCTAACGRGRGCGAGGRAASTAPAVVGGGVVGVAPDPDPPPPPAPPDDVDGSWAAVKSSSSSRRCSSSAPGVVGDWSAVD